MWSAFIVHDQVYRGNSTRAGFFFLLRTHKTPHRRQTHPFQREDFCGIHIPSTRLQMLSHCSKSARESEGGGTSQHIVFTVYLHTNQPKSASASPGWDPCQFGPPLGSSHCQNGVLRANPLLLSVRTRNTPHRCQPVPVSQRHNSQATFPLAFAKAAYPNRPTPPEYMVAVLN